VSPLRRSVFALIVLAAAGSLFAGSIDPGVLFVKGGSGSTHITCDTDGCTTDLPEIPADGEGDFVIDNDSGEDIVGLIFFIPTNNFDQIFTAGSNLFLNAFISLDQDGDTTTVTFINTGNGPDAVATPMGPLGSCPSCPTGFEAGGTPVVEAIFGTPQPGDHTGLLNGEEGTLELVAAPEPGTFLLLLSAAGLLLGGRKLYLRQAKDRL
jgi:hypothetical protein